MNNVAEYEVILTSMRIAKALGVKNLKLRTDSKLSVGQITNKYEAKEERMKRYLKLTNQPVDYFDHVKFEQIPRENNLAADEIAKLAPIEDADTHHESTGQRETMKYLRESCYHRIECSIANSLAALMWK